MSEKTRYEIDNSNIGWNILTCCMILNLDGEKSLIWALLCTNSKWGKWSVISSSGFGIVGFNISALWINLENVQISW